MGTNPETDALRKARTKQKIIETAFHVFAERTIDAVNMTDIAKAAGLAMTTVYAYYSSKEPLVMDVSAWAWDQYIRNYYSSFLGGRRDGGGDVSTLHGQLHRPLP